MANGDNGKWTERIVLTFIAAGAGFGSGSLSRVDPFTGSEGEALRLRITAIEENHREGLHEVAKSRLNDVRADMRENVERIERWQQRHDEVYPPKWLLDRVEDIDERLRQQERQQ